MGRIRAFVGIALTSQTVDELARCVFALREPVGRTGFEVAWVRPGLMHVTLKFLGDIEEEAIGAIETALRDGLGAWQGPTFEVAALGTFPAPTRARVIFAGVGGDTGGLGLLQGAVEDAMEALGHPREERAFHPHVTLGRVRARAYPQPGAPSLGEVLAGHPGRFGGPEEVREIILYESRPEREGTTYVPRARVGLLCKSLRL